MSDIKSKDGLLAELDARKQIHDCLVRWCRGVDICDRDLILSAYHDDAHDDHGSFKGSAHDFADWVIKLHLEHFVWTRHHHTNERVAINGDKASVESYVMGVLRSRKDGNLFDMVGYGRYLDRFECRNGIWRIVDRFTAADATRIDKVVAEFNEPLAQMMYHGTRDKDDISYQYFNREFK